METVERNLSNFNNHLQQSIDVNYRGIRIKVYKNGDEYDCGTTVVISRKQFKHWLIFLDFLTRKLKLMAPVHELYRIDGLRIEHFEEIKNGESYVAVSQGPFLHKPYGLTREEREKWNIDPKITLPEAGTLDSAESVDIYLKQRGYTSRTGLPFPFDGGLCVSHSLMDFRRSFIPPPTNHIGSKTRKKISKKDKAAEEQYGLILEQETEQGESNSVSKFDTSSRSIVNDVEVAEQVFIPVTEQNLQTKHPTDIEHTNTVTVGTLGTNSCNDIKTLCDQVATETKGHEGQSASTLEIPDKNCEFQVSQHSEVVVSHEENQTINHDHPLLTEHEQTIIMIGNDEASVRANNNPVIIVNISSGHTGRPENVSNMIGNDGRNANTIVDTTPPLVDQVINTEKSEIQIFNSQVLPASKCIIASECLQIGTELNLSESSKPTTGESTPLNTLVNDSQPLNAASRIGSPESKENRKHCNDTSPESNAVSTDCLQSNKACKTAESSSVNDNINKLESNLSKQNLAMVETNSEEQMKSAEEPIKKQTVYVLERSIELNDNSRNPEVTATGKLPRKSLLRKRESNILSVNSGSSKLNGNIQQRRSNRPGIVLDCKDKETYERNETSIQPANITRTSPTFLTIKKNPNDRKRVTLATPLVTSPTFESVDIDTDVIKLNTKPEYEKRFYDSEKNPSKLPMRIITHVDTNKNKAARNVNGSRSLSHSHRKCQPNREISFNADFTPRRDRLQVETKGVEANLHTIDMDLDFSTRKQQPETIYDPDFKDFDFI